MNRRRIVAMAAAVVLLVVGIGAVLLWPRSADPVTEEDALDDYRERAGDDEVPDGEEGPEPGVYRFAATGEEEVKLGALPAQTRPLPDLVTAVLVPAGDGCFEHSIAFFDAHTEDTTYCVADGRVRLAQNVKHQQVGAITARAEQRCDPPVDLPLAGGTETGDVTCELTMSAGPATLHSTFTGTRTVLPVQPVEVGDQTVEAVGVRVAHDVSGDLSGRTTETQWLATDTGLPVRIERTMELSGFATFRETSTLVLEDLRPTR